MNIKRIAAAAIFVVAAVIFVAGVLSAPAQASASFVRTVVYWEDSYCIDVVISDKFSTYTYTKSVCNSIHEYTLTESNVWPGDWIGMDPIMGSASWIGCTMWIDGVVSWRSAAYAGDGYDVNCLRVKN